MYLTASKSAILVVWIIAFAVLTVYSLTIPAARSLLASSATNNRHENTDPITGSLKARGNLNTAHIREVTMAQVVANMESLYGPGLFYDFVVISNQELENPWTLETPKGSQPDLRRMFKITCVDKFQNVKPWPPMADGAETSLVIYAKVDADGIWRTHTGYTTSVSSFWNGEIIDVRYLWVQYARDPIQAERHIRDTQVPVADEGATAFEITKKWVDKALRDSFGPYRDRSPTNLFFQHPPSNN
ncbi:MAG: hypothetical protein M1829_000334 [Trizodia sp. TS-e1964]|nr:MAG: hypothetical protein M1829_000334 [Trizodia sp. TS-e1964]